MVDKIFVVTSGEYSSYCIVGCFSSREKAESFAAAYDGLRIEEMDLDPKSPAPAGCSLWRINLLRDGVDYLHKTDFELSFATTDKLHDYSFGRQHGFWFTAWAEDEQHARKIGTEKYAQCVAMNLFDDNEARDRFIATQDHLASKE